MGKYDLRTGPQKIGAALAEMERRLAQLQLLTVGLALLFVLLLLASCTGVQPAASPLMMDAPPEPQGQHFNCDRATTETGGFTLACEQPTATPEPTATLEPTATATATPGVAFWYFWCAPGTNCQPFRVYWDPELTLLRCAIDTKQNGMKVSVKATMDADPRGGAPLAWVVTGQLLAGGEPCEGWVDQRRLAAAQ